MDLSKKVIIGAVFFVILFFILRLLFYYPGGIGDDAEIIKTVHKQTPCSLTVEEAKELSRSWFWARRLPVAVPTTSPDYILRDGQNSIKLWRTARLACDQKEVVFNLPKKSCQLLDSVIVRLETMLADRFGVIMPWDEAKSYFAMYCRAEIVDFKTGKSFRIQRRGGRYHADCQPLTSRDTEIMKEICQGRWSWERRAVIVVVGGKRIAASMCGMPHGAGMIEGNNFNGHFCVHFWGSKVHTSGKVDPEHQNRILQAAGKI